MKRFQRKLQLLLCHHPPDVKDLDPEEKPVSAPKPTLQEQENGDTVETAAATLDSHSSPETQGDNADEAAKQQSPSETCNNGRISDLAVTPTLQEHSSQENSEVPQTAAATLHSSPETQGGNTDDGGEAAKQQSPSETCSDFQEKDSVPTPTLQETQENSEIAAATQDDHSSPDLETQGDKTDDHGESAATEYEPAEPQETSEDIAKQQSPPGTCSNGRVSDFKEKDSVPTPTLQETQENSEIAAATQDDHSSPDLETQGDKTDDHGESAATEYEPAEPQETSEDIAKQQTPPETCSNGRVSDFKEDSVTPTLQENEEVAAATLDDHSSPDLETQGDKTDDRGESAATREPAEPQENPEDIAKQQSPPSTCSNGRVSDFQEKDSVPTPTLQETQENSEVAAATQDDHSSPDLETQGDKTDDHGESAATEYEPAEPQETSEDIAKQQTPPETCSDGSGGVFDFQTVFEKEEVEHKLNTNKVSLESLTVRNGSISGYIKVSNLAFLKTVAVRSTTDKWVTFKDTQAQYCESEPDNTTDRFSFELPGPSERGKLELAVCYTVNGLEWWDNNHGQNYVIVL